MEYYSTSKKKKIQTQATTLESALSFSTEDYAVLLSPGQIGAVQPSGMERSCNTRVASQPAAP